MKIKVFLFATVLLAGCQSTTTTTKTSHHVSKQSLSPAFDYFARNSRTNLNWLIDEDGQSEKNLWLAVSDELNMQIPENNRVREQKEFYFNKKNYLQTVTVRAEPYMYWIISQIKERKLPMELALLPIVESSFDPNATSSAAAAGLWQIIPTTGSNAGLRQDQWYDGRRDVTESTTAALDILERLYGMFGGDWLLTIAAYNCGEGCIQRAIDNNIAKGRPIDYWSLDLPTETMQYVPKLLALSDMVKNSNRYGLYLPNSNLNHALTRIEVGQQIELTQAAKMADIPLQKLKTYNAGYKYNVTAPNGPHTITLPINNAKKLEASLNRGETNLVNWGQHRVVQGETVEILARRYGISVQSIQQANAMTAPIVAGQTITLPLSSEYLAQLSTQQTQMAQAGNSSSGVKNTATKYTVRASDTLASIAKRNNVKVSDIQKWNTLTKNSKLKVGQTLQIASNTSAGNKSSKNSKSSITYRVRKGDTIANIAKRHNVDISDVLKWNAKLAKLHSLKPGDTLTLYKR
ncbi:MAG: LysM peptidoglycan-binding domain-containing protein [Enterobacteriaceae bacterium]|nr:LysM peptidoglycan-binding domain-containing protein [Enterobacteriaceae bacterium]